MTPTRTISISRHPSVECDGVEREATYWIVRVNGHEFVHGGEQALILKSEDDVAQFTADLIAEYGNEARIEVVGIDELGIPLPSPIEPIKDNDDFQFWMTEYDIPYPKIENHTDKILSQVCKALFMQAPPKEKVEIIIGSYGDYLRRTHIKALRYSDPAFVVANLKRVLPSDFVQFAEISAAFKKEFSGRK